MFTNDNNEVILKLKTELFMLLSVCIDSAGFSIIEENRLDIIW